MGPLDHVLIVEDGHEQYVLAARIEVAHCEESVGAGNQRSLIASEAEAVNQMPVSIAQKECLKFFAGVSVKLVDDGNEVGRHDRSADDAISVDGQVLSTP